MDRYQVPIYWNIVLVNLLSKMSMKAKIFKENIHLIYSGLKLRLLLGLL